MTSLRDPWQTKESISSLLHAHRLFTTADWDVFGGGGDQNEEAVHDCSSRSMRECAAEDFSSACMVWAAFLVPHTQNDIHSVRSAAFILVERPPCRAGPRAWPWSIVMHDDQAVVRDVPHPLVRLLSDHLKPFDIQRSTFSDQRSNTPPMTSTYSRSSRSPEYHPFLCGQMNLR